MMSLDALDPHTRQEIEERLRAAGQELPVPSPAPETPKSKVDAKLDAQGRKREAQKRYNKTYYRKHRKQILASKKQKHRAEWKCPCCGLNHPKIKPLATVPPNPAPPNDIPNPETRE
jgi:hypothetical protein